MRVRHRIEAGTYEIHLDFIPIAPIVQRIVESVEQIAAEKQLKIRCDVPAELCALGDDHALEHVLLNLVDNAVKYTPSGGKIQVRAVTKGDRVRIEVEDNGPGIEARHLGRIFERFYRVDTGRSRALGGTGLGLAIVRHLCEAMRAPVSVESAVGRGTTFHVDLLASTD